MPKQGLLRLNKALCSRFGSTASCIPLKNGLHIRHTDKLKARHFQVLYSLMSSFQLEKNAQDRHL